MSDSLPLQSTVSLVCLRKTGLRNGEKCGFAGPEASQSAEDVQSVYGRQNENYSTARKRGKLPSKTICPRKQTLDAF